MTFFGLCEANSIASSTNGLYAISRSISIPEEAVMMAFGLQSSIRIANSCGANPPKTTECVTPILAQASIAKAACGIIGI